MKNKEFQGRVVNILLDLMEVIKELDRSGDTGLNSGDVRKLDKQVIDFSKLIQDGMDEGYNK